MTKKEAAGVTTSTVSCEGTSGSKTGAGVSLGVASEAGSCEGMRSMGRGVSEEGTGASDTVSRETAPVRVRRMGEATWALK